MHYNPEREEDKHEMKSVNMDNYTSQMWFDEIRAYLSNVMGMNDEQIKQEFDKRFADLLPRDLI